MGFARMNHREISEKYCRGIGNQNYLLSKSMDEREKLYFNFSESIKTIFNQHIKDYNPLITFHDSGELVRVKLKYCNFSGKLLTDLLSELGMGAELNYDSDGLFIDLHPELFVELGDDS